MIRAIALMALLLTGCYHRGSAEYYHDRCIEALETGDRETWGTFPSGKPGAQFFCFDAIVKWRCMEKADFKAGACE